MFKKIKIVCSAIAVAIAPVLSFVPVKAVTDTCTWTGAVNTNWSNGGNWTGCDTGGVPEIGDSLIFPESAINKSTNNDFFGAGFGNIQITGTGYTLAGGAITLIDTVALTLTESATINLDITYQPSMNATIMVADTKTLTMNGATIFSGIGGEVNIGGGIYTGTVDFVGNIVGDAGTQFIAVDEARAIVRGAANTFTATTVGAESDGIFECRSATCFGDNANNIYMGNGRIQLYTSNTYSNDWETSAPSAGDSWLEAYASISITGGGTVNDAVAITQNTDGESLQFTGGITNTGGISVFGSSTDAQVRFDGSVSGSGGFSFGGATTYMSSNSNYADTNTVNSGAIVIVDMPTGLGATSGVTNVMSGGSVRFDFAAGSTVAEPLQIAGTGIAGEGALVQTDESVTLSGDVVLNGNATIAVDTSSLSSAFTLSGVISGTGDITLKTSPSTVVADTSIQFTGSSANTYVGKVIVSGVRFYPAKDASVTAVTGDLDIIATASKLSHVETSFSEVIADSSHITLTKNGSNTADLSIGSTATETIGYITGDGEVSLGAQANLHLSYAGDYTFDGQLSKFSNFPSGASTFTKQGAGTATFTGGVNTTYGSFYPTFNTTGGTLKANAAGFSSMHTNIGSGSTLKGSGSLDYVTIQAGGTINVGNSPGCMTLGTLDLTAGSTFVEEIAGATACSNYDQTTVTGTAALNDATLSVLPTYTPADGTVFTILTAGTVSGTFNGLANGATITAGGVTFRIDYTATSVTLTKLSGTATVAPNTGFQKQHAATIAALFAAAFALMLAAKRYGKKVPR